MKSCWYDESREESLEKWRSFREDLEALFIEPEEEEVPYEHDYNWQIPIDMRKHHQVMNRKPLFIHARSRL